MRDSGGFSPPSLGPHGHPGANNVGNLPHGGPSYGPPYAPPDGFVSEPHGRSDRGRILNTVNIVPTAVVYLLMTSSPDVSTCLASKSRPNLLRRFSLKADEPDMLCALCGKRVDPPPEVEVREGEKRYHLECYVREKRRTGRERPASD